MRSFYKFVFLCLMATTLVIGCVSVDDKTVQVAAPGLTDQYQRNVLDKCDPHIYPHRLIQALAGQGAHLVQSGAVVVTNQADFDTYWNDLTPALDENKVPTYSLKPIINFDQESAYFLPLVITSSCQKFRPWGNEMTTDCYNVTLDVYRYTETTDCQPVNNFPVYVYIYPKTNWPINYNWIDPTATPTAMITATATASPTSTPYMPTATPTP